MAPSKSNWLPFKNEAVQSFSFLTKKLRYLNWKFRIYITTSGKVLPRRPWDRDHQFSKKGPPCTSSGWHKLEATFRLPILFPQRWEWLKELIFTKSSVRCGREELEKSAHIIQFTYLLLLPDHLISHAHVHTRKLTVLMTQKHYPTAPCMVKDEEGPKHEQEAVCRRCWDI